MIFSSEYAKPFFFSVGAAYLAAAVLEHRMEGLLAPRNLHGYL